MNIPSMIASHMIMSNGIKGSGMNLEISFEDDFKWLFRFLIAVIVFSIFLFVNSYYADKTILQVHGRVIEAFIEPAKKSNGYQQLVNFKISTNGMIGDATEKVLYSECNSVIYEKDLPINLVYIKSWTYEERKITGMKVFCQ